MYNLTSKEFQNCIQKISACILPVGSYEQHGPHDILETDFVLADYIAKKIGEKVEIPVLPTVPYGISYVHKSFAGTIYITENTYCQYITEILCSLQRQKIQNVFILNAHGGNYNTLKNAVENVKKEGFYCEIVNWFDFITDDIFTSDHRSHAGSMETSALMAIDKSYIREDLVENMVPNENYKHTVISDMLECTYNGVILNADKYSYEKGLECINTAVEQIAKKIEETIWGK